VSLGLLNICPREGAGQYHILGIYLMTHSHYFTGFILQLQLHVMKKITPIIALTVVTSLIVSGCKKETATSINAQITSLSKSDHQVKRPYKDRFDTWFQFVPDFANGWDPQNPTPFLAWYPGGGSGNSTHMGHAQIYFNQYVPFNPPFFSSVHAPVNQFFSTELALVGLGSLSNEVSSVVFDGKGNSIWLHQTSNSTTPVNAERIEFTGTSEIIGGSGKFEGAGGEVDLKGYFNPLNQQDAAVSADGWILY
jgi:hypothetical protein